MKAVVTGANGTVGKVLCALMQRQGDEVVVWDRSSVPADNPQSAREFLEKVRPDTLFHLAIASRPTGVPNEPWKVNCDWPALIASITRKLNIRFVQVSTAMVFSDHAKGPFTRHSKPDATEGYGFEKRVAEELVLLENPETVVARLGWQIGSGPGSNNMIDYFQTKMNQQGEVRASTRWYPACSFLEDTAESLYKLAAKSPDLYMIDSNQRWTFHEIACALNNLHGKKWKITPTQEFIYDQRMQDDRTKIPLLNARLKSLS